MATPNEIAKSGRYYGLLIRAFKLLLGLGAIAWAVLVLPIFWREVPLDRATSELLRGHALDEHALLRLARQVDAADQSTSCNPAVLRDGVVVYAAVVEEAMAGKQTLEDLSTVASLERTARSALACSPGDSFAWLTLFWVALNGGNPTPQAVAYLRLSYATGPNEGRIALSRVKLVLPVFAELPDDLASDVIEDFVKLVDTGLMFRETTKIFIDAPPMLQSRMAERLQGAKPIVREIFARALYDQGITVKIPNTTIPGLRPWER